MTIRLAAVYALIGFLGGLVVLRIRLYAGGLGDRVRRDRADMGAP
jgi:hypothetical protein